MPALDKAEDTTRPADYRNWAGVSQAYSFGPFFHRSNGNGLRGSPLRALLAHDSGRVALADLSVRLGPED